MGRQKNCCISSRVTQVLLGTFVAGCCLIGENRTVVHPKDTGAILVNPGMGWVFHHYDNSLRAYGTRLEPWDTVDDFPGVGVIYLRLAWSYIEPEEGEFNWSFVDIPAQRWITKGKRIAFRFTCHESSREPATPEWVRMAGAKVYYLQTDPEDARRFATIGSRARWAPDYEDPIFLEKLDHFLAAAAARYDGDPNVAFIDVGSIGIWGECDPGDPPYTARMVRTHIDLHTKHFKDTLLVFNDNCIFRGRGIETLVYAKKRGLTLRDDSILCRSGEEAYYTHLYAGAFWPRLPVILESQHYGMSRRQGYWGDGGDYLRAVEDAHASYVSVHWWPREFLEENRQLVRRISLRMGYRLQLLEASFPNDVPANGEFGVSYRWRNAGVAPCLPGGYTCFTLKDNRGGIAGVFVDEGFNVRSLPVGPPGKAEAIGREIVFSLPLASVLKPGTYGLYISVGSRIGTPRIALPLEEEDGQRRYRLGTVRVLDEDKGDREGS